MSIASPPAQHPGGVRRLRERFPGVLVCTTIAAVGVKTSFRDLGHLGWRPVAMLAAETAFIAAFVLAALLLSRDAPTSW